MNKIILLFAFLCVFLGSCEKCDDEQLICTEEFRMVTIKLKNALAGPIVLDSSYTIRQSNNERIRPEQQVLPGSYVVLDDSYHYKLKNQEDNFRFYGWKNNQLIADQLFRIGGDNCHINKISGADIFVVQ
jgi:hypothetical protein